MPNTVTILGLSGLAASVGSYFLRQRHKQRGGPELLLEPGWLPHDGSGCPVPLQSKPGVMFRSRWSSEMGLRPAESWDHCWEWTTPGALDIIAYQPEPAPAPA